MAGPTGWATRLMAVAACFFYLTLTGCQTAPVRKNDAQAGAQPSDEELWKQAMNAGNMAARSDEPQRAIYHYMMAAKAKPQDAAPFVRIGQVHEHTGRADSAEQAYRLALAREATSVLAQEGLGLALLRQGKNAEAREQLQAAAAKDSTRWRVQNGLGVLADMNGNFPAARTHYQTAMENGGSNPRILNNFGYSYYLSNDWESAARIFTQAVEKDPKYWQAWRNLGLVRVREGRYTEAQTIFRKLMPEHEVLNTLGYLCTLTGDYENAENFLNQAIAASPSFYEDAYQNLEYLRFRM